MRKDHFKRDTDSKLDSLARESADKLARLTQESQSKLASLTLDCHTKVSDAQHDCHQKLTTAFNQHKQREDELNVALEKLRGDKDLTIRTMAKERDEARDS